MRAKIKPGPILLVVAALSGMLAAPALAGLYIPEAYMSPLPASKMYAYDVPSLQTGNATADATEAAETQSDAGSDTGTEETTVTVYDTEVGRVMSIGLEEYLVGVVAGEMPVSFGAEALKAQAVAARSYAMYKIAHGSQYIDSHCGAQLCTDSAHCKAYVTHDMLSEKWGAETADDIFEQVSAAVSQTKGEILTYEGEAALAVFHSSSDGVTESAAAVWGRHVPYLVSVDTPESIDPQVTVFTRQQLADALADHGISYDDTEQPPQLAYDDAGRVACMTFGDISIPGTRVREALGLRSTDFTPVILDGEYIFTARGYGHGVGMSQYGAAAMAAAGSTYREILAHYYPGTELTKMQG
jgi:stage II sporulation protein D